MIFIKYEMYQNMILLLKSEWLIKPCFAINYERWIGVNILGMAQ